VTIDYSDRKVLRKAPSAEVFLKVMADRNYTVFREGEQSYNLNIVGWRARESEPNLFNDLISVYWQQDTIWRSKSYPATTLPGEPWLLNPMSIHGTAILVPGQYLRVYTIGFYHGYQALKQVAPVKVYRDTNGDKFPEKIPGSIETGVFGIHIHKAGFWSKLVGRSSAGCQVFQKSEDFEDFMDLCTFAAGIWGNTFSYTLLDEGFP